MNTEKETTSELQVFDLLGNNIPNLSEATEMPFDFMADYWTPENSGECKRVFFDKIGIRKVIDGQDQNKIIDLECAFFLEQKDGQLKPVSNGSKRLVGALETNGILRGTPLLITYLGKKKNSTNAFQSDNWSVKPLSVKK